MIRCSRLAFVLFLVLAACSGREGNQTSEGVQEASASEAAGETVRIVLFNIRELKTEKLLAVDDQGSGTHPQALAAARVVQRLQPDVLVVQEIDHDYSAADEGLDLNARRWRENYLVHGDEPLALPHTFAAPNNTGVLTGLDLNGDGTAAREADRGDRRHGDDAFGFGRYPGEFSMAVLSKYPIVVDEARTFQKFLWKDLPGNHLPVGYYSEDAVTIFRLSSKSHWDLPIEVDGRRLHLLVSHPTPQGFDGDEDKNGRRNFDEIKLWAAYLDGETSLYDDKGGRGGYVGAAPFLIVGDLNAAPPHPGQAEGGPFGPVPYDGKYSIQQLLEHPRVQDSGSWTTSRGALLHKTDAPRAAGPPAYPERSTAVFGDGVRIDYLLPSRNLEIVGGGVFWPDPSEDPEGAQWAEQASDHRAVWLDVRLP